MKVRRPLWWWAMQAFWVSLAVWAVTLVMIVFVGGDRTPIWLLNRIAPFAFIGFAVLTWLLWRVDAARRGPN